MTENETVIVKAVLDEQGNGLFPSDTAITGHKGVPLIDYLEQTKQNISNCIQKTKIVSNIDLDTIKDAGFYECSQCMNTPDGAVILQVMNFNQNTVQIAYKPNSDNVYKRYLNAGIWSEWKLIAGEVTLWNGTYTNNARLTMSFNTSMFQKITAVTSNGFSLTAQNIEGNSAIMFVGSFVQPNNLVNLISWYGIKVGTNQIEFPYPECRVGLTNTGITGLSNDTIVLLIGRP